MSDNVTRLDEILYQERMNVEQQRQEFIAVTQTGAKLSKDGNQYCWLLGENLQFGIAGFGDTPHLAMLDFNREFYDKPKEG
jgi:hypothetical protein